MIHTPSFPFDYDKSFSNDVSFLDLVSIYNIYSLDSFCAFFVYLYSYLYMYIFIRLG